MAVRSIWYNCKISPQKARLAADVVRGMNADQALTLLGQMNTKAAKCFHKVLASAIANAENNHNQDATGLCIQTVTADKARALRRYMARAKGRGDRMIKPYSHLTIVLGEPTKSRG